MKRGRQGETAISNESEVPNKQLGEEEEEGEEEEGK